MKNLILFLLAACLQSGATAQTYWQQQTAYTIDVRLNEKEKTLDGFETISYTNNSPDTLRFIWFHLWPNAYKNDRTAFSDQLIENGNTRFYFSEKEQRGFINRLDFRVNGTTAKTEDHPQHIDIIKVLLPKPLAPGAQAAISTPFHVKLPYNFSRGGFDGESFQVTQWYPKPAVYDKEGWHPLPYLDQGEFYSEFGTFDVQITVPKNFVVAATGELQTEEEKLWLRTRSNYILPVERKNVTTLHSNRAKRPGLTSSKQSFVSETKTMHFKQIVPVHDFAWFANKHFIVSMDTLQTASGRSVEVSAYYTPAEKKTWVSSLQLTKEAMRFYSEQVGEYPYNTATVVQGPQSFGGGMEYPTIAIISPTPTEAVLDETIAHEVGHNWFYGLLASNERNHPWMDEGMTSFYTGKYVQKKYGKQSREEEVFFQGKATNNIDQPINTPAAEFSPINYSLGAYHKAAEWMKLLEQRMGEEAFREVMQNYFQRWKFKHPQPEDFKEMVAQKLGPDSAKIFSYLSTKGILPGNQLTGTSFIFPLKKGAIKNYLTTPTKNAIVGLPLLGFNTYDKVMVGGLLTNYGSPTASFNFLAIPLFATGSKSFTGLGKINYAFRAGGFIRRTDLFLHAASFNMNEFRDENGYKHRMRFAKLVPGVKFTFKEKNPRSTANKFIQWKTFLINEESLAISFDSIFTAIDTTIRYNYSTSAKSRYLNQLQFGLQNFRALYPFDITLQLEQAQDFLRTTFTANYFFNYAKGGGLSVRLFAGKLHYLGGKTLQKQFANDRYHLNMTGANGYEDYTYSNYFLGRNKFDGLASQQIMMRDGGFKVRTDLLASKVGKTDDWLVATNFVTTVPEKINPLALLPIKIPLRLFADVGTYAEAWDRENDTDRFLFDIGLQFSLLHETINIYVPLLYSKVYSDYFKSTIPDKRFFKTISFSINFFNKDLKKLHYNFDL